MPQTTDVTLAKEKLTLESSPSARKDRAHLLALQQVQDVFANRDLTSLSLSRRHPLRYIVLRRCLPAVALVTLAKP